ncbi:unnamed protein product [Anisakis simplex]|uniref:Uncharacterized protein n=1 Tax=Anisakis simplex TaxID=6269 RepID=A0A0M3K2W1_ANISI|nr:unnamed protein product [Anisakis simplex]
MLGTHAHVMTTRVRDCVAEGGVLGFCYSRHPKKRCDDLVRKCPWSSPESRAFVKNRAYKALEKAVVDYLITNDILDECERLLGENKCRKVLQNCEVSDALLMRNDRVIEIITSAQLKCIYDDKPL